MIRFRCPACNSLLEVLEDQAGKKATCRCSQVIRVPGPASAPATTPTPPSGSGKFATCPECQTRLALPPDSQGRQIKCQCGHVFATMETSADVPTVMPQSAVNPSAANPSAVSPPATPQPNERWLDQLPTPATPVRPVPAPTMPVAQPPAAPMRSVATVSAPKSPRVKKKRSYKALYAVSMVFVGMAMLAVCGGIMVVAAVRFAKDATTMRTAVSSDGVSQVDVPSNWRSIDDIQDDTSLRVGNRFSDKYLAVMSERRSAYQDSFSRFEKSFVQMIRQGSAPGISLNQMDSIQIDGREAIRYQCRDKYNGVDMAYYYALVQGDDYFHTVEAYSRATSADEYEQLLEKILPTFRERR